MIEILKGSNQTKVSVDNGAISLNRVRNSSRNLGVSAEERGLARNRQLAHLALKLLVMLFSAVTNTSARFASSR